MRTDRQTYVTRLTVAIHNFTKVHNTGNKISLKREKRINSRLLLTLDHVM